MKLVGGEGFRNSPVSENLDYGKFDYSNQWGKDRLLNYSSIRILEDYT